MWKSNEGKSPGQDLTGWLSWAGRHPGVVLLGSLLLAALLTRNQPRRQPEADTSAEEVPLFI